MNRFLFKARVQDELDRRPHGKNFSVPTPLAWSLKRKASFDFVFGLAGRRYFVIVGFYFVGLHIPDYFPCGWTPCSAFFRISFTRLI